MAGDGAEQGPRGGPWDFDLPDLGASTTPGHHRRRPPEPQQEPPAPTTPSAASGSRPSRRGSLADDDLLPDWVTGPIPRITPERARLAAAPPRHVPAPPPVDTAEGAAPSEDPPGRPQGGPRARRPVAPEPPGGDEDEASARPAPLVWNRRRLSRLAAAAAALLLIVVVAGFALRDAPQEAEAEAQSSEQPTTDDPFAGFTPRPSEASTGGPSGPAARACGEALEVRGATSEQTYAEGQDPTLVLTLANTGDTSCMVNAGTARMEFVVSSGSQTVFDSRHCQVGGQDRPIELDPGEEETARLPWDRRLTAPGCPADLGEAAPGAYQLQVALGSNRSEAVDFVLE